MRAWIAGLIVALTLSGPGAAQDSDIEATISAQISAFLADDFATAFSFASPTIKDIFQTPENFGGMVRNGYPMVWRPSDVQYLDLREYGGRYWQKVMISDQKGTVHILEYQMIRLENDWKINGVRILESAAANV